jgi:hypothetical protein
MNDDSDDNDDNDSRYIFINIMRFLLPPKTPAPSGIDHSYRRARLLWAWIEKTRTNFGYVVYGYASVSGILPRTRGGGLNKEKKERRRIL